jgi:hypothetical protein
MRGFELWKLGLAPLGCLAVVVAILFLAPVAGFSAQENQSVAAADQSAEGQRSYYFSRTAEPYASYEEWLKANPRHNHPYHDTVHGSLFSDSKSADPQENEAKTKPYLNQRAFRTRPKYQWGYQRILWVNDRYYSGKYYPTAKGETESK